MNKFIKSAIFIIIIISVCFFMGKKYFYKDNDIILSENKYTESVKYRGLKDALDFDLDEDDNFYIAYKDKIQTIKNDGKSFIILSDKDYDIKSLAVYKDNLYFVSNCNFMVYDMHSKKTKNIISNIPNYGDYNKSLISIYDNHVFISIGAATNSGVVGEDNFWIKQFPYNYDISPFNITVKGNNNIGAFVPYGSRNIKGQIISAHVPGNASIISYDIKTGSIETYAWGIRNIKGMGINSQGKIIATVGGIEDRGLRGIKGDTDYVYEIDRGVWYGWPDYSGGDPITSPRFKSSNGQERTFILEHPSINPPAPFYQHDSLNSLGTLCIDSKGVLSKKDSIYFYDSSTNDVYCMQNNGIKNIFSKLPKSFSISSIKFDEDGMIMLDKNNGYMISIINNNKNTPKEDNNNNKFFLLLLSTALLCILYVVKQKDSEK